MSQQPALAEPEPEPSPVRAKILKHLLWIRLGAFAACTLIFIIFFYMGSQTAISREASIRLLDELRAVIGPDPTIMTIITNNVMISLLLLIPAIGVFFLAFVSHNSGVVLAAISQIEGFNPMDVFIASLLWPWSWFEIIAYGLAASQGVMLLIALLTRRFNQELRTLVIVGVISIALLSVGAVIEIMAIG
jgi:heme/copper-type cytochrome/quinol oxidase subunit 2